MYETYLWNVVIFDIQNHYLMVGADFCFVNLRCLHTDCEQNCMLLRVSEIRTQIFLWRMWWLRHLCSKIISSFNFNLCVVWGSYEIKPKQEDAIWPLVPALHQQTCYKTISFNSLNIQKSLVICLEYTHWLLKLLSPFTCALTTLYCPWLRALILLSKPLVICCQGSCFSLST